MRLQISAECTLRTGPKYVRHRTDRAPATGSSRSSTAYMQITHRARSGIVCHSGSVGACWLQRQAAIRSLRDRDHVTQLSLSAFAVDRYRSRASANGRRRCSPQRLAQILRERREPDVEADIAPPHMAVDPCCTAINPLPERTDVRY